MMPGTRGCTEIRIYHKLLFKVQNGIIFSVCPVIFRKYRDSRGVILWIMKEYVLISISAAQAYAHAARRTG